MASVVLFSSVGSLLTLAAFIAQLTADRIDSDLANQIKDAVQSLEHIKVTDLMALLARIHVD